MKPSLFVNPRNEDISFYYQQDRCSHFYDILHYHPEIQIMAVVEGTGTLFVGDTLNRFKPGDVILIGANLPHVARNDEEYYDEGSGLVAHANIAYFSEDAFGDDFFKLPEMLQIRRMLANSSRGMRFSGVAKQEVYYQIEQLGKCQGFERLMCLFEVLNRLSLCEDFEYLASVGYKIIQNDIDSQRISDVQQFVMQNYSDPIRLDEVAQIANMSPTSFCRYFKQHTRKTFSDFLSEIRIGNACTLLASSKYTVSEVSFMCGFNNISNFNRRFKRITSMTPLQYAGQFKKSVGVS